MTDRMVLVVADHADLGVRVAAAAAARTHGRTLVITGDDLVCARWSHRLSADGRVATTIGLPDGRVLTDDDLVAVLFRSQGWQVPVGLRSGSAGDVAYARAELTALLVSWLGSLGTRVLNAVEGTSPAGPAWSPARWRQVAADVGFAVSDDSHERSVVVAGGRVTGAFDDTEAGRCRDLAAAAGCRLVEVSLTRAGEVCDVATVPLLNAPEHVAALAALLTEVAA